MDHEHLIRRVAGTDKSHGGNNDFKNFRPHASAAVDNQSNRSRHIIVAEGLDLLEDSVLVNLKVFPVESQDGNTLAVSHGRVQDHYLDVYADPEWVTRAVLLWRGFKKLGDTE